MTGVALIRPLSSIAWELRSAWALGRRISVTVEAGDDARLEGTVRAVAATGAFAVIGGQHVPLERVLAVHRPSRLGDSKRSADLPFDGRVPRHARHDPHQLRIEPA
jgi:hypothetical protein